MGRPKGRPNQGKTRTIRERTVNVYLPTKELVEEWKTSAKDSGLSLSQYILEAVERERVHGSGPHLPKLELEKTYRETQEELSQLKSKYEILEAAFQKRDQDAKQLSELLERRKDEPSNLELARKMVELFKNWPEDDIDPTEVPETLGVHYKDKKRMSQIRDTRILLESLGLLKSTGFTWYWLGDRTYEEGKQLKRRKPRYATKITVSK